MDPPPVANPPVFRPSVCLAAVSGCLRRHRLALTYASRKQCLFRNGESRKVSKPRVSLTYRDAGVDIDAGDALVESIKPIARATRRPGLLAGIGGFGAMFEIPPGKYREPVLVSSTDGVGTKLK